VPDTTLTTRQLNQVNDTITTLLDDLEWEGEELADEVLLEFVDQLANRFFPVPPPPEPEVRVFLEAAEPLMLFWDSASQSMITTPDDIFLRVEPLDTFRSSGGRVMCVRGPRATVRAYVADTWGSSEAVSMPALMTDRELGGALVQENLHSLDGGLAFSLELEIADRLGIDLASGENNYSPDQIRTIHQWASAQGDQT
jgi:hypothetical protein